MTKEERIKKALDCKHNGYNCCQAVTAALGDLTTLDEEELLHISAGFGAGMGNMEGSCGALVGAALVAGMHTKGNGSMRVARQISERFSQMCGATVCKDIKGMATGRQLCSCDDCVQNAVRIFCEVLDIG